MTHWLWLQLAKGKSVARGSPGAETCAWALAPRFLYLEFLKRRFIAARISAALRQEPPLVSMQPWFVDDRATYLG